MNIIITNSTVNTINEKINSFSTKINRGDNKNILYTLPYIPFTKHGWKVILIENIFKFNDELLIDRIKNVLNTNEEISKILFFRANTLITKFYEQIKMMNIFKIIYVDDLHNSLEILELRNLDKNIFDNFNLILSTYKYCFNKFFHKVNLDKVYWFPHSFNEQFKIDYNNNPKNKIILSGAVCDAYPMRQKMYSLLDKYPIDVLQHPKYSKYKLHDIIGKKFIEKLNNYRFGFTCCLNYYTPYMVQKFFEIPGSGSLLIAYDKYIKEPIKELGFKDMINYISVNEDNLIDKLNYIFDEKNYDEIEKIRFEGYNFINNNHTHELRTIKFLEYIKNN